MARAIFQTVSQIGKTSQIADAMKLLRDRTRSCPGYSSSSIEQDIEDARKLRLTLIFDCSEHLRMFLQSEILVSIFQLVELSTEQPDIFFCWEDGNSSLESIIAMKALKRNPHNSRALQLLESVHSADRY